MKTHGQECVQGTCTFTTIGISQHAEGDKPGFCWPKMFVEVEVIMVTSSLGHSKPHGVLELQQQEEVTHDVLG